MSYQLSVFFTTIKDKIFFIKCCFLSHSAFEYYRQLTRIFLVMSYELSVVSSSSFWGRAAR
jgi:hypothetical protein